MTTWRTICAAMCLRLAVAAAVLGAACGLASAQATPSDPSTIHVYTNLLQIPVLILSSQRQPLPPIAERNFSVRLGDTPAFRPRLVRLEGDDPITLAVLIDGSGRNALLPALEESLPAMVRDHLHEQDRVVMYGMDGCKLRRFGGLGPADSARVRESVRLALSYPAYDAHARGVERCAAPVGLWDAASYVTQALRDEPGRRVLLAISDGLDTGSNATVNALRHTATYNGTAIFSLAERYKVAHGEAWTTDASPLGLVSEGSGGMILEATRKDLPGTLTRFVELLRGRYIVEFSRPEGMTAGTHQMSISCGVARAFIRSAGTSMPVADPIARDPTVEHGVSAGVVAPAPSSTESAPIR